jgi:hypothetical protein
MYCTVKASEEGTVAEDHAIFTQEQHEQLLATAVEKASAEATATADAEVLSLNERLEAATTKLDEAAVTVSDLETQITDRDEADRLSSLEGERVDAVQAVVTFSDEQVEKRKESWSKMDDEAFADYLEDIKEAATASTSDDDDDDDDDAPKTNFDGTRTTAGADDNDESALVGFFSSNLDLAAQS